MTDEPTSDGEQPRRKRRRRRRRRRSAAVSPASPAPKEQDPSASASKARSATRRKRRSRKGRGGSPVQREVSAGGVVYRRSADDIEVLLASRRTRRGELAWGLAKGGVEQGETFEDAALREVLEETGYTAEIEASLGDTRYFYVWGETRIRKTVHFFLMRCTGGDPADRDDEMEEVRWFPLQRALKRAAYRGEREILGRAAELLS